MNTIFTVFLACLLSITAAACTDEATGTRADSLTTLPVVDGTLVDQVTGYVTDPCVYFADPDNCDADTAERPRCETGTNYVQQGTKKSPLWCRERRCSVIKDGIEIPSKTQNGCVSCKNGGNPNTGTVCKLLTVTTPD